MEGSRRRSVSHQGGTASAGRRREVYGRVLRQHRAGCRRQAGARDVRRQLCELATDQEQIRPDQPVQAEREHQAGKRMIANRRKVLRSLAAAAASVSAARLWADAADSSASLSAVTGAGKSVTLSASEIRDLRAGFRGQ